MPVPRAPHSFNDKNLAQKPVFLYCENHKTYYRALFRFNMILSVISQLPYFFLVQYGILNSGCCKREHHSHFPLSSLVMCHLFQSYLHLSTFCCIDSPVLTKRHLSGGDILFNTTNTVYSSYKKKNIPYLRT